MGAALMTRDEIGTTFRAVLDRYRQDRRNEYRSYSRAELLRAELDGRVLPRHDLSSPEYRGPATLGEWLDDRVLEWGRLAGDPAAPFLVTLAEAARGGADAAVRVVREARRLEPRAQLTVFRNLELWRRLGDSDRGGADGVIAAVLGEWSRLRLPEADPDE